MVPDAPFVSAVTSPRMWPHVLSKPITVKNEPMVTRRRSVLPGAAK